MPNCVDIQCKSCNIIFKVGYKQRPNSKIARYFCSRECSNRYGHRIGLKHSQEAKEKMSKARKGKTWHELQPRRLQNQPFILQCQRIECNNTFTIFATTLEYAKKKQVYCSLNCAIRNSRRNNKSKLETNFEIDFIKPLHVQYLTSESQLPPEYIFGRPDFVILQKDKPILIFVDGCYWHGCQNTICRFSKKSLTSTQRRRQYKDNYITNKLKQKYTVLRFWEHDILSNPMEIRNQLCRVM